MKSITWERLQERFRAPDLSPEEMKSLLHLVDKVRSSVDRQVTTLMRVETLIDAATGQEPFQLEGLLTKELIRSLARNLLGRVVIGWWLGRRDGGDCFNLWENPQDAAVAAAVVRFHCGRLDRVRMSRPKEGLFPNSKFGLFVQNPTTSLRKSLEIALLFLRFFSLTRLDSEQISSNSYSGTAPRRPRSWSRHWSSSGCRRTGATRPSRWTWPTAC